jgi:fructose-1,6-bisphosphatase I
MTVNTIEHHLLKITKENTDIHFDIAKILYDISLAAKIIRKEVLTAGLSSYEDPGKINIQGEHVKALDMFSNDCLKSILSAHGRFSYIGSEEEDEIVTVDSSHRNPYTIFFDPLDGSSNIDVNISVGTIFSVFKTDDSVCNGGLPPGRMQVAAGYIIYGSSVMMVYSAGKGVHGFTYEPSIGEFLLSHEQIRIPEKANYYSINESLYPNLDATLQAKLDAFKTKEFGPLSSRYVGSLVADFHRNLLKGGVFLYPGTASKPAGKLRLMYEANPLSFICEQAGGAATNGKDPILDILPTDVHQRVPLFLGNKRLVEFLQAK